MCGSLFLVNVGLKPYSKRTNGKGSIARQAMDQLMFQNQHVNFLPYNKSRGPSWIWEQPRRIYLRCVLGHYTPLWLSLWIALPVLEAQGPKVPDYQKIPYFLG